MHGRLHAFRIFGNVCAVLPDVWHVTSSDQGFIQDFELGGGQDDSSVRKCA